MLEYRDKEVENMMRRFTKYLLIALSLCLLFGISPAYAQTDTPTPAVQPLMIFTENAHADNSLDFIIISDGTSDLAIAQGKGKNRHYILQETGTITSAQLDSINTLRHTLSDTVNSYGKGDYSFSFMTDDGQIKSVELSSSYQHVD